MRARYLNNMGGQPAQLIPELSVTSETDNSRLVRLSGEATTVPAGESKVVTLSFGGLKPRLWSPDDPALYTFAVDLSSDGHLLDSDSLGGYHVAWKNPDLRVLAEEMKAHGYLNTPNDN